MILALFAVTLFLSGFLMFLVEPMVAKMLLPVLGGTAMVWSTCVVFFQMMLLAGYGYAHGTSRWMGAVRHRPVHVALVVLPLVVLPLVVLPFATKGTWTPPQDHPLGWLLLTLVTAIGLPFFALATTAVLQHWFSRTGHSASRWWAAGYALFAVLTGACGGAMKWLVSTPEDAPGDNVGFETVAKAGVSIGRRARWVVLSFVPASLMLGVTTYLSTDIAAVPLMWTFRFRST